MFIKRIFKIGLAAIMASALTTTQAQVPKPKPEKPKKEKPERGGKKWDPAKAKERLKTAFEQRKKRRGDAKKRGHKVRKESAFGKLVRDDAKIKELREAFRTAADKMKGKFDRKAFKDATDEEKAALREKMAESRKEWIEKMKSHRQEVQKRMKELHAEFKNNRDEVIDGNKPGD
jgi:seryl-tRNA synthetase